MGILPVALGLGEAAMARRPLGIAVVAGMISSTFLTLIIVPVVYILVGKLRRKASPVAALKAAGTEA
jgi:HAE1 family hydrophobic/amphiphilic exporter-1